MTISTQVETHQFQRAARALAGRPVEEGHEEAEELRREQDGDRQLEQLQRAFVVEPRPGGKQRKVRGEILRPNVVRLQHQHDADQQLRHPYGRSEIAHDASREMLSRRPDEPFGAHDARVLEITLAPSPVARRKIDQRRRAFFVRPAERRQHVDRVSSAAHERRLDEIVAEDMAPERGPARKIRHAAMIGERAGADDRVMAPIIAVAPHPGR